MEPDCPRVNLASGCIRHIAKHSLQERIQYNSISSTKCPSIQASCWIWRMFIRVELESQLLFLLGHQFGQGLPASQSEHFRRLVWDEWTGGNSFWEAFHCWIVSSVTVEVPTDIRVWPRQSHLNHLWFHWFSMLLWNHCQRLAESAESQRCVKRKGRLGSGQSEVSLVKASGYLANSLCRLAGQCRAMPGKRKVIEMPRDFKRPFQCEDAVHVICRSAAFRQVLRSVASWDEDMAM